MRSPILRCLFFLLVLVSLVVGADVALARTCGSVRKKIDRLQYKMIKSSNNLEIFVDPLKQHESSWIPDAIHENEVQRVVRKIINYDEISESDLESLDLLRLNRLNYIELGLSEDDIEMLIRRIEGINGNDMSKETREAIDKIVNYHLFDGSIGIKELNRINSKINHNYSNERSDYNRYRGSNYYENRTEGRSGTGEAILKVLGIGAAAGAAAGASRKKKS